VGGVAGSELRQPDGDRTRCGSVSEHGVDAHQAARDNVLAEAGDHAHELITTKTDEVMWPELSLQRPGDVVQQPVPGGVPPWSFTALSPSMSTSHDQRLAVAPGPAEVTLKLQQTRPTQVGPGVGLQPRRRGHRRHVHDLDRRGCVHRRPPHDHPWQPSRSCSEALRSQPRCARPGPDKPRSAPADPRAAAPAVPSSQEYSRSETGHTWSPAGRSVKRQGRATSQVRRATRVGNNGVRPPPPKATSLFAQAPSAQAPPIRGT